MAKKKKSSKAAEAPDVEKLSKKDKKKLAEAAGESSTGSEKKPKAQKKPAKKAKDAADKSKNGKKGKKKDAVSPEPAPTTPATEAEAPDGQAADFTSVLKVREGFVLADVDASGTPGFSGGRREAEDLMKASADELADLQERLYASERVPGGRSVLLIVQGMDTSGKGGIMRHVVGGIDPQGVQLTSFKAPTKQEREHPFLWRIRNALPKAGYVGVFDRSQYEDVLIVRVHDLVARPVWMRRYGQINAFEESTASKGTTIVKIMLHIDADEQKARLMERLDNPEKYYKFNPDDVRERGYWEEYQAAYQAVLDRTSTDVAPWFVVPANQKWYARLAVQQLLLEHLRAMNLAWPKATFDVDEQRAALEET